MLMFLNNLGAIRMVYITKTGIDEQRVLRKQLYQSVAMYIQVLCGPASRTELILIGKWSTCRPKDLIQLGSERAS
jgi:hypothetical protein